MATLNSPGDSGAVESVSISATNLSIDAANIQAEVDPSSLAGLFLSVNADDGLQVDVSDGLRNDGTNAISVDASTITEGVLSEGSNPHNIELNLGNGVEDNNNNLRVNPDAIAGNALTEDTSATLGVANDSISSSEFDLSASPIWTSLHTFGSGIVLGSTINMQSNLITNLPSPSSAGDVARKEYVDGIAQGLNLKESCRASTDGTNIDLTSATDPNPIDGVTLNDGDRVLLKDQTTDSENGIYVSSTATDPTTWTRAADFDEDAEVTSGSFTFVSEGNVNAATGFVVTSADPIVVGTDAINFSQFSGAGDFTAGDGISKSGNEISVFVPDFTGAFLSDDGSNNVEVNIGSGLITDGSDNIRVDGSAVSDGVLEQGSSSHQVALNFTNGLENDSGSLRINPDDIAGDGLLEGTATSLDINPSDFTGDFLSVDGSTDITVDLGSGLSGDGVGSIRIDASTIASGVLEVGANPFELDVGLGNGVENNSGSIRVNPADIAGDGLFESSSTSLAVNANDFAGEFLTGDGNANLTIDTGDGLVADGSSLTVDESFAYSFSSQINFLDNILLNGNELVLSPSNGAVRFDTSADSFKWEDKDNNLDRMELDRSTGDLNIEGELTEGAAL